MTTDIRQKVPTRHIYRWDLDKTYLDTDFRLKGLITAALEGPAAKRNVPGVVALLKGLTRGERAPEGGAESRVVFISGSPHQMRGRIEEKFRLDGLRPVDLHLKPNLQNFFRLRWRAIREQVGFKLPLLLESRVHEPSESTEVCFGDDSESDALIYSMYADLVAGRIGDFTLCEIMRSAGAYEDAVLQARSARSKLIPREAVDAIFIHLTMHTPPERFDAYGPRVIPVRDYFQAALVLHRMGRLDARGVVDVARELMSRYGFTRERLARSFYDIMRRGFITRAQGRRLGLEVESVEFAAPLPDRSEALEALRRLARKLPEADGEPPPGARVDYPTLIETLREKVDRARSLGLLESQHAEEASIVEGVLAEVARVIGE